MEEYIENDYQTPINSQPVCIHCLTPFKPLQHYCANCGEDVGNHTRYIPFVKIPFEINFYIKVWKLFWNTDTSYYKKLAIFPILLISWGPLFIIIGLPFELWKKYKKKQSRTTQSSGHPGPAHF